MATIGRRAFLKGGAFALLALGLPPSFVTRAAALQTRTSGRRKTVIFVFQRGAVDGLSMIVPFGEPSYYEARGSIAIGRPGAAEDTAIDLDGRFGLHPALGPLHDLWRRDELAVVHACGSPHPTRSHFDAQDFMESGTPGVKATRDGWMNRLLAASEPDGCACGRTLEDPASHASAHALAQSGAPSPFRGVSLTAEMPRALRGPAPTVAIPDLADFGVGAGRDPELERTFERLYRTDAGDLVAAAADGSFEAIAVLREADPLSYAPRDGVAYPPTPFGSSLRQIAQLIKADVGVEVAFADLGGWDTHVAQGGASGRLAARLDELARGLRALYDDLGDRMEDVLIASMSEFGRTVAENGSGGTDHGHGNCMFVLGGAAAGGRIVGRWPGLERERLYEGRDLAVTTDFRDLFAEISARHLGVEDLEAVFPGHPVDPTRFPGVLR